MLSRSIPRLTRILVRSLSASVRLSAKGDESTIDSYKLPSQTSINEWEFKYDFVPKTSEPKVPPITKEAVQQDIAQEKAKQVETELFVKESNSSVKVEANSATVVHGGEAVSEEPAFLHKDSTPTDSSRPSAGQPKKPANRDKYIQSSINPDINQVDAISLGESDIDHKTVDVDKQTVVVEDHEHDNLHHAGQEQHKEEKPGNKSLPLIVLGLGGVGYYYYTKDDKKVAKVVTK